MHVLTLKTQTAANIKFPGYLVYTKPFNGVSWVYRKNLHMKRELHKHYYIYVGNLN